MKKYFISLLLILLFIDCTAQIIINKPVDITIGDINFNPQVITKNKIKSITVFISDKPDGSIIIDKGAFQIYQFNEKGYVNRYNYTILNKIETEEIPQPAIKKSGKIIQLATTKTITQYINDMVFLNIIYNEKNSIITKRIKAGNLFNTYYYEYNEAEQIKKEVHYKETNISENKNEFILGEESTVSSEMYEYIELTNTQTKKKYFNDNLNVYKKGIINYDDKKNKLSENSELIVSCTRQENIYEYDNNNRLIKQIYTSNENGELKMESVFDYDNNGNLVTEKKFKNNVLILETHYLYDNTNTFIKSEAIRDYINSSVIIKKYEYSFY